MLSNVTHGKDGEAVLDEAAYNKDGQVARGKDGEVVLVKINARIEHGLSKGGNVRSSGSLKIVIVVQVSGIFQCTSQDDAFNAKSTYGASIIEVEIGALSLRNGQIILMNIKHMGVAQVLAMSKWQSNRKKESSFQPIEEAYQ